MSIRSGAHWPYNEILRDSQWDDLAVAFAVVLGIFCQACSSVKVLVF
jgi:hypothetical protein